MIIKLTQLKLSLAVKKGYKYFPMIGYHSLTKNSSPNLLIIFHLDTFPKSAGEGVKLSTVIIKLTQLKLSLAIKKGSKNSAQLRLSSAWLRLY